VAAASMFIIVFSSAKAGERHGFSPAISSFADIV
jgi:hypothetical protein